MEIFFVYCALKKAFGTCFRAVVSNPEQNVIMSHRPGSARPGQKRGTVRTLHDSQ